MRFKSFQEELKLREELSEELKIKSKNWNFNVKNWSVEVNDKIKHSLIQRSQLRTEAPLNTVKKAIQTGLDYIVKKVDNNKLTNRTMVSLTFTKSDFKVLVLVNPDEKYLRVSTIMNTDMQTKKDIKWNLNEFEETFWKLDINESETFAFDCDADALYDFETLNGITFLAEPSLVENITHEVYQQIDIENFNLDI